jgi:heme O synthase-like polyprenyltransferase
VSLKPYLQLTRPANLVTAVADILAGLTIAEFTFANYTPIYLVVSTLCLYGGGVVLNDVFDAKLDAVERPERPIPSGRVSLRSATLLGISLLVIGVLSAAFLSELSGGVALVVALLTLLYNRFAKHSAFFGPLVMGMCRGGNLILGITIVPASLEKWGFIAIVPVLYIAAITLISQDEVHGGKKRTLYIASLFYFLVLFAQILIAAQNGDLYLATACIALHASMIGKPLKEAIQNPIGPMIGKAVKAGVLSLIVMNASWCIAFGYLPIGLAVLALLPLSLLFARMFAVT